MIIIKQQPFGEQKQAFAKGEEWERALAFFPSEIRSILARVSSKLQPHIYEIRFRSNQPLELVYSTGAAWLSPTGELVREAKAAVRIGPQQLRNVVNALTAGSFYALEEAIAQGYLALPGGFRAGFAGHAVHEGGKIRLIRDISSLNFRIARAFPGIARQLLPLLWKEGRFLKTLILAPPAAGKTTLLREIIREVSTGVPEYQIPGIRVGLVDERSEIAGSFQGEPQLDVGCRTDVLDGCTKQAGVYLLLRAMNPELIATDEIGTVEDFKVIEDIINTGVSFIATAHARNLTEAICRAGLKQILELGMVERVIVLSNRLGAGTIENVKAGIAGPELWPGAIRPGESDA
ncbi:MAG TPA: stage III sporulation protein AA [Bacillota bacterium]